MAEWNAEQSFRIGGRDCEESLRRLPVKVWPEETVSSVTKAVEALCSGKLLCPAGFCAIWSRSQSSFYVLYRCNMWEASQKAFCLIAAPTGPEATCRWRMVEPDSSPWSQDALGYEKVIEEIGRAAAAGPPSRRICVELQNGHRMTFFDAPAAIDGLTRLLHQSDVYLDVAPAARPQPRHLSVAESETVSRRSSDGGCEVIGTSKVEAEGARRLPERFNSDGSVKAVLSRAYSEMLSPSHLQQSPHYEIKRTHTVGFREKIVSDAELEATMIGGDFQSWHQNLNSPSELMAARKSIAVANARFGATEELQQPKLYGVVCEDGRSSGLLTPDELADLKQEIKDRRDRSAPACVGERGRISRRKQRNAKSIRKLRTSAALGSGGPSQRHGYGHRQAPKLATYAEDGDEDEEGGEEAQECGVAVEEWPEFLQRARATLAREGIPSEQPGKLFEAFRVREEIDVVYAAFVMLFFAATTTEEEGGSCKIRRLCGPPSPPWAVDVTARPGSGDVQWSFPYEAIKDGLMQSIGSNFRASKLWKLYHERCQKNSIYLTDPLGERRAIVVGAGPCGLRAAIELRLLGADVTVVEQRQTYSRINQLHLWKWCADEIKELGAGIIEPPPASFAADPALIHAGIGDLQVFCLKVALLFGVEVLFGVCYEGAEYVPQLGWRVNLKPGAGAGLAEGRAGAAGAGKAAECGAPSDQVLAPPPSARAPPHIDGVHLIVGSNGFSTQVSDEFGMTAAVSGGLRQDAAIGLIVNLKRQDGQSERNLRSFNMASQFFTSLFKECEQETGCKLENIVYTKAHSSHYFVMTPTNSSLQATGVIKNRSHEPLLAPENVDLEALDRLVQAITAFRWKRGADCQEPPVLEAIRADNNGAVPKPLYADGRPRLFDFSQMRRSVEGMKFVRPPGAKAASADDLLVGLCGDALMEPFWPEGLGIVRGFFSVLDFCSAVAMWFTVDPGSLNLQREQTEVETHFQLAYTQLKTLSGSTRDRVLKNDVQKKKGTTWMLDPATRYRGFIPVKSSSSRPESPSRNVRRTIMG